LEYTYLVSRSTEFCFWLRVILFTHYKIWEDTKWWWLFKILNILLHKTLRFTYQKRFLFGGIIVSFVNRKNMIGCIILKPVNFLNWRRFFIGFMSWSSHCSYENSRNGDIRTLLWIYTIRWTRVGIYIDVNTFFWKSIVTLHAIYLVSHRQEGIFSCSYISGKITELYQ
jgi:hypothetical protein